MFDIGTIVNDRYRLDALIARGGMGQVWRSTDTVLGRTVAVKVLHEIRDQAYRGRFRNEARAMAALHHPGVADVYDYGETTLPHGAPAAFIVMACVDGEPLSRRIAEAGRLDAAETAPLLAQVAEALQAVHDAGVVHRDVKPANLIVEPDGHVVLIDFGVAVTADGVSLTAAHQVVGTALYMAPEQVTQQPLTPATDVYALGAVAYHCLAGHPPFLGDDPVTVALRHLDDEPAPLPDDVPEHLRRIVATAMAKDPRQRFPTAAAMAAALAGGGPVRDPDETVLVGAPVPVPTPLPTAPRRSRAPHRVLAGLLVGLAALLAVVAFADPTGIIRLPGEQPQPPAVTTDPTSGPTGDPDGGATAEPAGGAGGDPQSSTGGPDATTGPGAGSPVPADEPGSSPAGEDPAAPEPTPPADEPDPTPPADEPDPTPPADEPDPTPSPADEPDPTPPADEPESTEGPATRASPGETARQ